MYSIKRYLEKESYLQCTKVSGEGVIPKVYTGIWKLTGQSKVCLLLKSETRMTARVLQHDPNTYQIQKKAVY